MRRTSLHLLLCIMLLAARAHAEGNPCPGSAALVEDANEWDRRVITFTGEAVGEAMRRGDMAWIHLNDDPYGLEETVGLSGFNSGVGVWAESRLVSRIAVFGGYGRHGDIVEVTGTFHAACPAHGGDLDIHADSLRIVRAGHDTANPISRPKMLAAAIMAASTAGLFLAFAILRRRSASKNPGAIADNRKA